MVKLDMVVLLGKENNIHKKISYLYLKVDKMLPNI